jgi:hypothetical protein
LNAGTFVEPDKVTVAAFLQRWLAHIKTQISPASFERYRQYANIIIPALGGVQLTKLKPEHISGMYSKALETAVVTARAVSHHGQFIRSTRCSSRHSHRRACGALFHSILLPW